MTATETQALTDEQIENLIDTLEEQLPCPTCHGASQESDTAPHCNTCDDYGWFANPAHPANWE